MLVYVLNVLKTSWNFKIALRVLAVQLLLYIASVIGAA